MEGDMVVALTLATRDRSTRFARLGRRASSLCRIPGREFAPGEKVRAGNREVPQIRQTFTVLGARPAGCAGFEHGVNEHGVAAGCVSLPPAHSGAGSGLCGTDLVRLVLERSHRARQAVEMLTHLLEEF